jgi:acyl-CoA dehydrogenase
MSDISYLDWPFFEEQHRVLARDIRQWCGRLDPTDPMDDVEAACRALVRQLGTADWLRYVVPQSQGGRDRLDLRSICLIREQLARCSPLADFVFAMQGLGSAPIGLHGPQALKERYLPRVAAGLSIAAFALSEDGAGSDVRGMQTIARRDGSDYVLDGEKVWISNAGLADFYVVFCRCPVNGKDTFVAVVVDADNPGLCVKGRTLTLSPHPLGSITLRGCRVPSSALLGGREGGLKVAFSTLDLFRSTVGAAALGYSRRALEETLAHVTVRKAFGQALAEFQLTKARLAEMEMAVDCSALLVFRAAWLHDSGAVRVTRESALAKLYATESAQVVIDSAVQLFGARGVVAGAAVERLYRDIRALRIYEGTSEIQKLIIADHMLKTRRPQDVESNS